MASHLLTRILLISGKELDYRQHINPNSHLQIMEHYVKLKYRLLFHINLSSLEQKH